MSDFLRNLNNMCTVYRTKNVTFSDWLSKQNLSQTRLNLPKFPKILKFFITSKRFFNIKIKNIVKNMKKCGGFKGPVC